MSLASPTSLVRPRPPTNALAFLARFAPLIFLLLLMALFTFLAPRFLSSLNLFNVLRQVSIFGIVAVGMTFVILTRGIDLSIGALIALTGLVAAVVAKGGVTGRFELTSGGIGLAWYWAALAAILVGGIAGALQGVFVAKFTVPAFVVTLGGMTIFRGLALIIGNGGPISGFDENFGWFGRGMVGAVPVPVIVFLVVVVIAGVVLHSTRYGRSVYAIGSNPEAARLCGLNVNRTLISVYALTGLCSGLGGFLLASRLNSAEAVAGSQYELNVIAAVVIGGTSLYGGTGNIAGTVIGTLLIGVLLNGLVILNVSPYVQQLLIGAIIIGAVTFDILIKKYKR
ncbi:monosaccharide ABC transporter membrane protein, CUT2 family (TC 3.A.1.2.-) [Kaistia soli DSM 19436]|uniref:Monosaccharide ABC transporter membrane protein, CUT2 family (TC 3.A.1.2.-) n=1 Tax=Kaistia soli DSM 19436 TaxID=1122133 RepID=A0A1M5KM05_9HYPH|nr:ABC transporter permease [Kaistia soli]SHG53854.1 monosaccharide ABC transporter membrane protein, CUT2 family (TC 3.A.1.2.-) [Kaistia soli DSM 19436]